MNQSNEFAKSAENSKTSIAQPRLSDYLDYRQYLKDFYQFKREQTKRDLRPYSYQVFSSAANIKSPNYLKMIIEGKRNLSDDMIVKFAKAMGFNKDLTEEFKLLVLMNQCPETADRNMYLKDLSEHRVQSQLKSGQLDRKTWEKIPNWVAWVLYAMIDQEGVQFDVTQLKNLLRGKAADDEIETALNSLIQSGEVIRDPKTGALQKAINTEAPDEIPVALVRKLQAQLMYLGLESLYQDAPTEREFGTLTMSLTQSEFEEIKFKLRQLRKSLHKDNSISRKDGKGDRVYQLNIQLFPVTNSTNPNAEVKEAKKIALQDLIQKNQTMKLPNQQTVNSAQDKKTEGVVSSLLQQASSAADLFNQP